MRFTIRVKLMIGFWVLLVLIGLVGFVGWRYNARLAGEFAGRHRDAPG